MRDDLLSIAGVIVIASMLISYRLARSTYATYASLAFAISWTLGAMLLALERWWPIAAI